MKKKRGAERKKMWIKTISIVFITAMMVNLAGCSSGDTESEVRTYTNVNFDYSEQIAAYNAKSTDYTTPNAANMGITVTDKNGATGVELVASIHPENKTDFYLNALVAGNELTFNGNGIQSVTDKVGDNAATEVKIEKNSFAIKPASINADNPIDEIISITMLNGNVYNVHMANELLPYMDIAKNDKESAEAGVYTFLVDQFLLRVNSDGNIVYYRNLGCIGENIVENFQAQDTEDGRYYTYMVELNSSLRNAMGGFSSGMYVVMDKNYNEVNYVTLSANDNKNHTHGEGYLDQHEFLLLGKNHWIGLSYTQEKVDNLAVPGIDGGSTAYVQAGIIQEVKDGKVIHEYNTVDYPELYASAKEYKDYAKSTNTGTADGYMDYVHVNSVAIDPNDDNLLVSMRNQYAVYKFDRNTGDILWILGGADNQFSGLENYMDMNGNLFVGQHFARYVDSKVAGNDSTISVFNNNTNYKENLTKTYEFTLDEKNKTAIANVVQGSSLDSITGKLHWATHCGSFERLTEKSSVMGWGFNASLDMNPATINRHALLTDYNPKSGAITFELSINRNPNFAHQNEACFSYRVYKNVD